MKTAVFVSAVLEARSVIWAGPSSTFLGRDCKKKINNQNWNLCNWVNMIAAGQLIRSLQSIGNVAKTNSWVKTYPGAIWQPLRGEKGQLIVDEECNLNLLLPPSGRSEATWLPHNHCLLVPSGKMWFRLQSCQPENISTGTTTQFTTSSSRAAEREPLRPSRPGWQETWKITSVKWTPLNPSEHLQSVLIWNILGPTVTVLDKGLGMAVICKSVSQTKSSEGHLNEGQQRKTQEWLPSTMHNTFWPKCWLKTATKSPFEKVKVSLVSCQF